MFTFTNFLKLFVVVGISLVVRLFWLTSYPPSGADALWLRLPSALSGVITIILLILLVWRLTKNTAYALLSGLFLSLMPWHIEQSRVSSEAMLGLLVLLAGGLLWTVASCKKCKLVLVISISIIFFRAYPSFWLFHPPFTFPTLFEYLGNIFKLVSAEFLFYKNDSFWLGGLRTTGALLPSMLPLLVIGIGVALQKFNVKMLGWLILGFLILGVSAASPLFPEEREFFLITPYLAVLLGLGALQLVHFWKKSLLIKCIMYFYFALIIYDYVLFAHSYIIHYPQRIEQEIPYEKRTF